MSEEESEAELIEEEPIGTVEALASAATATATSNPIIIMATKVNINNEEFEVEDAPQPFTPVDQCLYKKEQRDSAKDRNALLEKATQTQQHKFDLMRLSVTDPEKLTDTYNLQMLIQKMKQNHLRFDLADVFNIVKTTCE
jgi:mevalonate kinase